MPSGPRPRPLAVTHLFAVSWKTIDLPRRANPSATEQTLSSSALGGADTMVRVGTDGERRFALRPSAAPVSSLDDATGVSSSARETTPRSDGGEMPRGPGGMTKPSIPDT